MFASLARIGGKEKTVIDHNDKVLSPTMNFILPPWPDVVINAMINSPDEPQRLKLPEHFEDGCGLSSARTESEAQTGSKNETSIDPPHSTE